MLGRNNGNVVIPVFMDENCYQYPTNASNQLQLFGNFSVPAGCSTDPVNYFGNQHIPRVLRPNKRSRESEALPRPQKLPSLNYNVWQDEADRSASIPNPTAVSTGLRLSYDDDERNSSLTSASGSMAASPLFLFLGDNIRTELNRHKEECDTYIKIQEEHLTKGVRDLGQRHMASFVVTIETGVNKKLQEKDIEIENMNRKNTKLVERITKLVERIKQVTMEGQNWHYNAKYNESVVNVLKSNLQQAIPQGATDQGKEGFGDSEVDDASSYIGPNNYLSIPSTSAKINSRKKEHTMTCRACNVKEVSMLWMSCRHLCLCKE